MQHEAPDANEIARTRGPGALRDAFDEAVSKANGKAGEGRLEAATNMDAGRSSDWWRTKLITASDLCDQQFPNLEYVVPGIIPEGVTLLVSRPKLGMSWVLLQVGTAVATGVVALVPDDNPLHGDVLYLALEDNPRRLQRRLTKYFGRDRRTWPSRLIIVTEWKRLDQGGLEAKNEMRSRSQQLQPSSIKGNPAAACGLTGGAALQTVSRLAGIHSTPASRPGVITDSRAHRELRQR